METIIIWQFHILHYGIQRDAAMCAYVDAIAYKQIQFFASTSTHTIAFVLCPWQCVYCTLYTVQRTQQKKTVLSSFWKVLILLNDGKHINSPLLNFAELMKLIDSAVRTMGRNLFSLLVLELE